MLLQIEWMSEREEVRYGRRRGLQTSKESEGNERLEEVGARKGS